MARTTAVEQVPVIHREIIHRRRRSPLHRRGESRGRVAERIDRHRELVKTGANKKSNSARLVALPVLQAIETPFLTDERSFSHDRHR